jgi:hypothetical protein
MKLIKPIFLRMRSGIESVVGRRQKSLENWFSSQDVFVPRL